MIVNSFFMMIISPTQSTLPAAGVFNPALAGRVLILRRLLRYDDVHFISQQLAARWLIPALISLPRIQF